MPSAVNLQRTRILSIEDNQAYLMLMKSVSSSAPYLLPFLLPVHLIQTVIDFSQHQRLVIVRSRMPTNQSCLPFPNTKHPLTPESAQLHRRRGRQVVMEYHL